MLALQLDPMGLGADGAFNAAVAETVAERVARIRHKMLTYGIPAALITGGVTTLVAAGAFAFAKTDRVWAPSLWLGGVSAVAGLLSVALAAKTASDAAEAQNTSTITVTPDTSKSSY